MAQDFSIVSSSDYLQKLTALGIDSGLIKKNLEEADYQRVYDYKLRLSQEYWGVPLDITQDWQLQCLKGNVAKISGLDIARSCDNQGLNPSHYSAWSGNPDALSWVKHHHPELLTKKDKYGRTIAHYAAWSGNPEALGWVLKHYPELLIRKDRYAYTIAHYAALSGSPAVLCWVKNHYDELLAKISGSNLSFIDFAAYSGNSEQLNYAIACSDKPHELKISGDIRDKEIFIRLFLKALVINYSLTNIVLPFNADSTSVKKTEILCARNKKLKEVCQQFETVLQGVLQHNDHENPEHLSRLSDVNILFNLFNELLSPNEMNEYLAREVFKKNLPELNDHKRQLLAQYTISQDMAWDIFNKMIHKMRPEQRFTATYEEKILKTLWHLLVRVDSSANYWPWAEKNQDIRTLLEALQETVESCTNQSELKKAIITFYHFHKEQITHQRNYLPRWFQSNHKTAIQQLFDKVFAIAGISQDELSVVQGNEIPVSRRALNP
ncbi:ankyrin repeat domain-containing protein [Legionella spiritensis]|uniref:Ankyrin repeats (3 copies) n=1 Tax=Legionella spiritensis TaxID=452 RepID=A0A0W0Z659_LEGSP|nr:ankyrin repeat domain-containing protein [Legionella spiritensis]KTD64628.1 Ankyrin repeats (3 copies) [Legionella spiritensis]SNV47492.1 Ankyrin repeats (3 copies) [Legionella spiritensis]